MSDWINEILQEMGMDDDAEQWARIREKFKAIVNIVKGTNLNRYQARDTIINAITLSYMAQIETIKKMIEELIDEEYK